MAFDQNRLEMDLARHLVEIQALQQREERFAGLLKLACNSLKREPMDRPLAEQIETALSDRAADMKRRNT